MATLFGALLLGGGGGSANDLGYFATEGALTTAHPTATAGNYAVVGSTDTVWVWDADTVAWVDSHASPAAHDIGGAQHNADTFANVDAKISDAGLVKKATAATSTVDEVPVFTDGNGNDIAGSGVLIENAPVGGSGFTFVEYTSTPTPLAAGFLWIQAKDASTKTLSYYDGTNTFSVDLSI